METLFRWSKLVSDAALEDWETRLTIDGVCFTAEKPIRRKRWQIASYSDERLEAERLKLEYGGSVSLVSPEDWEPQIGGPDSPPIRIRSRIIVTEASEADRLSALAEEFPDRIILSFPPQLAFGTGSHPTTAHCLRFLTDLADRAAVALKSWRLLDLGCGSGILAIAAIKLGASEAVAVEFDEQALAFARRNAERHGVSDRITFHLGDAIAASEEASWGQFEIVAANLFSDLLVELYPKLIPSLKKDGDLIVSGFLTTQTPLIVEAGEQAGLPLIEFARRGKWVAARSRVPSR
ncbi:MAG: 50S ribosomal protein L11 methyltransferase [Verrucomicrobiota bacterium]